MNWLKDQACSLRHPDARVKRTLADAKLEAERLLCPSSKDLEQAA